MSNNERRTSQRFGLKLPLTIRWTNESSPAHIAVESQNVSSRGVYFFISNDVKKGSALEILMTLPHEITLAGPVQVRCLGHVQRTEPAEDKRIGVVAAIERYEFVRSDKN